jgi:hypothetical protein
MKNLRVFITNKNFIIDDATENETSDDYTEDGK